jgi:hypothetical protein
LLVVPLFDDAFQLHKDYLERFKTVEIIKMEGLRKTTEKHQTEDLLFCSGYSVLNRGRIVKHG